ncbi:hypothetical protein MHL30_07940 [Priestia flexa]|uniref:hypothetical protein n=1 Tax=Priestia flexa TaxID=86664 RepID=UPI001EF4787F|nr:hypothetical protein [Priestia flexa]MCG7313110.1 hypothetical protein [Priestia flexa]
MIRNLIKELLPPLLFGTLSVFLFYHLPEDKIYLLVVICPLSYLLISFIIEKILPDRQDKREAYNDTTKSLGHNTMIASKR